MPKFQDIFAVPNTPYRCTIQRIKMDVPTRYGPSNVVTMVHGGAEFEWWLKPDAFARHIKGRFSEGDQVDVSMTPPTGTRNNPSYSVSAVSAQSPAPVAAPTPAPAAPAPAKTAPTPAPTPLVNHDVAKEQKAVMDEREAREDLKDRRISISGFTQALVERGMPLDEAKVQGYTLAVWARNQALAWQNEDYTKEAFGA